MKNRERLTSAICYLLLIVFSFICILFKQNLNVDEVFTYTLSNSLGTIAITPQNWKVYEPADEVFIEQMTVQKGGEFNFANVWRQQSDDVHPPFYYLLVHSISSLFTGKFSIWFAASINIIFLLGTLFLVRRLMYTLTGNGSIVQFTSLYFIFCAGILSEVTFFRMYVVAMFFVTWITLIFVKDDKGFIFYYSLFVASFLGVLTHYYIIVFLIFISFIFIIQKYLKRERSRVFATIGTLAGAGLLSVMIFPSMLKHIFKGYRGTESVEKLKNINGLEYLNRLQDYLQMMNEQVLGRTLLFVIVFGVVIVITRRRAKKEKFVDKLLLRRIINSKLLLLVIPQAGYILIIAKASPYITARYLNPIYAIGIVSLFYLFYQRKEFFKKQKYSNSLSLIIILTMSVNTFMGCQWEYIYRDSASYLEEAKSYHDVDCIYIYDRSWKIQPSFYELRNYKSVMFIPYDELEQLDCDILQDKTQLIVCMITNLNKELIMNQIQNQTRNYGKYIKLNEFGYATTYFFVSIDNLLGR